MCQQICRKVQSTVNTNSNAKHGSPSNVDIPTNAQCMPAPTPRSNRSQPAAAAHVQLPSSTSCAKKPTSNATQERPVETDIGQTDFAQNRLRPNRLWPKLRFYMFEINCLDFFQLFFLIFNCLDFCFLIVWIFCVNCLCFFWLFFCDFFCVDCSDFFNFL